MVGQDGSNSVDEIDDVRPGNETDVGQAVMTGCKSVSADENAFKMFRGERSGKDVIHPDDRKDILRYRYLPVSTAAIPWSLTNPPISLVKSFRA